MLPEIAELQHVSDQYTISVLRTVVVQIVLHICFHMTYRFFTSKQKRIHKINPSKILKFGKYIQGKKKLMPDYINQLNTIRAVRLKGNFHSSVV